MKKAIVLFICLFSLNLSYGQDFEKGGNYITVGYSVDPYYPKSSYYGYKHVTIGPIVTGYERGITDVLGIGRIGVGGTVGISFHNEKYYTGLFNNVYVSDNWMELSLMAKAAYHFEFDVPGMDVYAGVGIGAAIGLGGPTRVGHREFVGIRYYFAPAFGVYAEVGYGLSLVNAGVAFAF